MYLVRDWSPWRSSGARSCSGFRTPLRSRRGRRSPGPSSKRWSPGCASGLRTCSPTASRSPSRCTSRPTSGSSRCSASRRAFPALLGLGRELQADPAGIAAGLLPTVVLVGLILGWVSLTRGDLSAAFASEYRALAAVAGTYVVLAWNAPVWKALLEPALRALLPSGLPIFRLSHPRADRTL